MKNSIKIILIISLSLLLLSNDETKTTYIGGTMNMVFSKEGEVINTKPMGKDVTVTYDSYFKSYLIQSVGEFGRKEYTRLTYIKDSSKGFVLMKDENETYYYVSNKSLNDEGILNILWSDLKEGILICMEIKDLEKQ